MKRILLLCLLLATICSAGCAHKNLSKQEKFLAAAPHSILIVPVINNSVEVTASDYMLATITIPLAERGYYVFPINLVKRVLEDDGLSDSSLVHSAPTQKLANLFGADAVLYITIEKWDAQYMLLTTSVSVGLKYEIRDGKTGDTIWENKETMVYQSQGGGNIIAQAIAAAVTKAAPNYIPLARQANVKALTDYPGSGIPIGPYLPMQQQ